MGCFNDLPKDVIWLILRGALFRQRKEWSFHKRQFQTWNVGFCLAETEMLLTAKDLEQRVFNFTNKRLSRYFNWLSNFALINRKCLSVIKSKTKRINVGFTFIPGSLTTNESVFWAVTSLLTEQVRSQLWRVSTCDLILFAPSTNKSDHPKFLWSWQQRKGQLWPSCTQCE